MPIAYQGRQFYATEFSKYAGKYATKYAFYAKICNKSIKWAANYQNNPFLIICSESVFNFEQNGRLKN